MGAKSGRGRVLRLKTTVGQSHCHICVCLNIVYILYTLTLIHTLCQCMYYTYTQTHVSSQFYLPCCFYTESAVAVLFERNKQWLQHQLDGLYAIHLLHCFSNSM